MGLYSLSAISEPRVEILERVAWQLFRVLDGTEEMGRVGGSFRLAQSAGDTAYLRALESTEKAPALPQMWDRSENLKTGMTLDEAEKIIHAFGFSQTNLGRSL